MFSTVSSSLTMNLLVYEKNSPNLARTSCFCLACEHLWMQTSKTFVPVITKPFFFFFFRLFVQLLSHCLEHYICTLEQHLECSLKKKSLRFCNKSMLNLKG